MSEEQPRNAQAGQRQKQLEKERRQANGNAFSNYDLTRKNEDFMYQLNKQLDRLGVPSDKKDAMLKETIDKLLAGQKKGQTARALFGTPTEYKYSGFLLFATIRILSFFMMIAPTRMFTKPFPHGTVISNFIFSFIIKTS